MKRKLVLTLVLLLVLQSIFIAPFGIVHASTNNSNRYDQPKWFETDPLAGQTWDEYKNAYGLPM